MNKAKEKQVSKEVTSTLHNGGMLSMFSKQSFSHGGGLDTSVFKVSFLLMEMFQKYVLFFLPSKVD